MKKHFETKRNSNFLFGNIKVILMLSSFFLLSCVESPSPDVKELIPTGRPTIQGVYDISLSASSSTFIISGTCDTKSYGLQYSTNLGQTWTDLAGGCSTGNYSFNVLVANQMTVYVRARTQFAFTLNSTARLRVILPPTAPLLTFVSSGQSSVSSLSEPRLSFTMSSVSTGERTATVLPGPVGSYHMDHHVTGIVYAE